MNYIEGLKQQQILELAKEMQVSRLEKPANRFYEMKYGKMYFYHTKENNINQYTTSIYDQFEIIQLYDLKPSEYDQQRYRNFMIEIFGEAYKKDCKKFLKNKEKAADQSNENAAL